MWTCYHQFFTPYWTVPSIELQTSGACILVLLSTFLVDVLDKTVADLKILFFHLSIKVIFITLLFEGLDLCPIIFFQKLSNLLSLSLSLSLSLYIYIYIYPPHIYIYIYIYIYIPYTYIYIHPTPPQVSDVTKHQNFRHLNFSSPKPVAEEPSLTCYLPIFEEKEDGFLPFLSALE